MKRHFIATGLVAFVLAGSVLSWTPATKIIANTIPTDTDSVVTTAPVKSAFESYVDDIYQSAGLDSAKLDLNIFRKALVGYLNLKQTNQVAKSVITVVDFTRSSREKRMWIIDLTSKKLMFNTLVAHGQGSGDDLANSFSNTPETHQSSLGFYVTENTYIGKHGLSLRLTGLDKGFNNNALSRAIVLHGAEYVSQQFINQHGRLGRSYGCPAVPVELTADIINSVKGKSCIFINGPAANYTSPYLDEIMASSNIGVQPASLALQAKI